MNDANARELILCRGTCGRWLEFPSTLPDCCRLLSGLGASTVGGRLGRCARRRLPPRDGRVLVVALLTGSTGIGGGNGIDNTAPIFMDGLDTGDLPLVPAGFVRTILIINGSKDAVPILRDDLKRNVDNLFALEPLFYAEIFVLPLQYQDLIPWLQYWKADVSEDTSVRATTVLAHNSHEGDQRDAANKMVEPVNRKYERGQDATDGTFPPVATMRGQDARLLSPSRHEAGMRRHEGVTRHVPAGVYSQDARIHQRSSAHGS